MIPGEQTARTFQSIRPDVFVGRSRDAAAVAAVTVGVTIAAIIGEIVRRDV